MAKLDMPSMTASRQEMDELTNEVMGLSHTVSQEMPSMITTRQEKGEMNHNLCHCTQHVAKEMTELNYNVARPPRRVHIKSYSPSL